MTMSGVGNSTHHSFPSSKTGKYPLLLASKCARTLSSCISWLINQHFKHVHLIKYLTVVTSWSHLNFVTRTVYLLLWHCRFEYFFLDWSFIIHHNKYWYYYAIAFKKWTRAKYDWHAWYTFEAGTCKFNVLARWSASALNDELHISGIWQTSACMSCKRLGSTGHSWSITPTKVVYCNKSFNLCMSSTHYSRQFFFQFLKQWFMS